ncbi:MULTISPECIES: VPLPA-CTERM sorting domain-containing protein [unclassified Ruegeria]|uniref:VPLPA-CTERM sorting domain-containing protein n=1 Tax=unclassified Ruegeria TaxID=2625375 RepID=UPI001AE4087F|nr:MULTISPECIES: VPLPA-CTERM sorting domain-containing protein [unclassified Ruegeria]
MLKSFKMVAVALAAVVTMAGSASALTSVSAGGSYDITSDNAFIGNVIVDTSQPGGTGPGTYSVNFTSPLTPLLSKANASVTLNVSKAFTGLSMSWIDAATNSVISTAAVLTGVTTLNSTFTAANTSGQNLVFSWAGVANTGGNVGFDFDVAAVPLPAGGLLLLTALGGLAVARRRKTA